MAANAKSSTEVDIATIRAELKNQGKSITTLVGKVDKMSDAVTTMGVTMGTLVTKESCATGRSALAEDLKQRMYSQESVNVGALVQQRLKEEALPASRGGSRRETSGQPKKDRGPVFWFGLASALITIVATLYGASTFISKTIERQERSDRIMIELQQHLQKQQPRSPMPDKAQSSKNSPIL